MSKRAKTKTALSGIDAQFQTPQKSKLEPKYRRKTYLLTDEHVERLAALAVENRVGVNDLARYLLDQVLTLAESGELPIPTRTEQTEEVPGRIVIKTVVDV